VGSDNPQNKILRGIRPHRTRSCGVSDPTEPSLARYQILQNTDRDVYILLKTPVHTAVWGLILHLAKSCRVSDPAELRGITFNANISVSSKQNSKIF
jgi:hypothetical protein